MALQSQVAESLHSQNGIAPSHSIVIAHAPSMKGRLKAAHDSNVTLYRSMTFGVASSARERWMRRAAAQATAVGPLVRGFRVFGSRYGFCEQKKNIDCRVPDVGHG